MPHAFIARKCALALLITSVLAGNPAFADKPDWAGQGKGKGKGNEQRDQSRGGEREEVRQNGYFGDSHRTEVREYYGAQFKSGHCPPGLAKKQNGCMPPGQAKKWAVGQPLPRDLVYHEVPRELVVKIGPPPNGYRYVQVAADILLIAVGTAMVIDAIQNIGGR